MKMFKRRVRSTANLGTTPKVATFLIAILSVSVLLPHAVWANPFPVTITASKSPNVASIILDGSSTVNVTAQVLKASDNTPVPAGSTVTFTTDLGTLNSGTQTTDSSGNATVALTSGSATGLATVTATTQATGGPYTTTVTVYMVNVKKLQDKQTASPSYSDVGEGTVYIPEGKTRDFQAVPDPDTATFPDGEPVWDGSSGATGTGAITVVSFSARSSSSTDAKGVRATCGNAQTASVLVFGVDITPSANWSSDDSLPNSSLFEGTFGTGTDKPYGFVQLETNPSGTQFWLHPYENKYTVGPSGLGMDLTQFGSYGEIVITMEKHYDDGHVSDEPVESQVDGAAPSEQMDRDGSGNSDVYYCWDDPGISVSDVQNDMSDTHIDMITYFFTVTTVPTYQTGMMDTTSVRQFELIFTRDGNNIDGDEKDL